MKFETVRMVLTALLGIAALAASDSAIAQTIPEAKVAVLDYQRILRDSSAAIDIKAQIERQRQLYQEEITKQEQELRATDQELTRQRTVLAPEAFAQRRREFEARVAEVQRGVQTRKRDLDQAYDYGIKKVQLKLVDIISALSKERGFNLVLSQQQVVFADNALAISDDVLLRLNEILPKIAVPLAQN